MDNPLDAALSDQPASEQPQAPDAGETPALRDAAEAPARGPDGKFVAKDAGETPALRDAEPPVPDKPEPGHVPLSAMLDEREQRQAAQKALKELQDRLAAERSDWQRQNPPSLPEQIEAARYADNLRYSRKFAERQYGPELVKQAHDWAFERCETDPFFNEQMRASDDPYEAALQAFNREQIVAKVNPERLAAFEAWEAAQAQAQQQQPPPPQSASAPPRSLVNAPGNGAAGASPVNIGEGEAFRHAMG